MSLLNDLINMFTGQHPQAQPQTLSPQAQPKQYMNQDGSLMPLGQHPQAQLQDQQAQPQTWQNKVPVGQRLTPQDIARLPQNVQQNAQIYNQNPMDQRVMHMDPAQFGYAPDNTVQPIPQPPQPLTQGIQGGVFNPGYIPLQNSGQGGLGYSANLQPAQSNIQNFR